MLKSFSLIKIFKNKYYMNSDEQPIVGMPKSGKPWKKHSRKFKFPFLYKAPFQEI
jgi:hypothetical protein